jgi:hypothetical protein
METYFYHVEILWIPHQVRDDSEECGMTDEERGMTDEECGMTDEERGVQMLRSHPIANQNYYKYDRISK